MAAVASMEHVNPTRTREECFERFEISRSLEERMDLAGVLRRLHGLLDRVWRRRAVMEVDLESGRGVARAGTPASRREEGSVWERMRLFFRRDRPEPRSITMADVIEFENPLPQRERSQREYRILLGCEEFHMVFGCVFAAVPTFVFAYMLKVYVAVEDWTLVSLGVIVTLMTLFLGLFWLCGVVMPACSYCKIKKEMASSRLRSGET